MIRDQVFISYSHPDREWLNRLQIMLTPLQRQGALDVWADTRIQPGQLWKEEIKRALAKAKVAVLLVSSDFLASRFIHEHELPPLLEAAKKAGLTIIWVPVRPCLYQETVIGEYQAAYNPETPLSTLSAWQQEVALTEIAQTIKSAQLTAISESNALERKPSSQHKAPLRVESKPPDRPKPKRGPLVWESATVSPEAADTAGRGIVWVPIPGGRFRMGSEYGADAEKPVHDVTLAAFEIARDPVTNVQYAAFVEAKGVQPPRHWRGGQIPEGKKQHPVVYVSWNDARAFCEWLTSKQGDSERRIRLLTEAQWEYAARGSEGRAYPWGPNDPDAGRCNFNKYVKDTTPVGSYPRGATPEGVHDLAGNVWEWVEDAWHPDYDGAPADGSAWTDGKAGAGCVVRGGSWFNGARCCRSACRGRDEPGNRDSYLGFRPARVQAW